MELKTKIIIMPLLIVIPLWILGSFLIYKLNTISIIYFYYLVLCTLVGILIQIVINKQERKYEF